MVYAVAKEKLKALLTICTVFTKNAMMDRSSDAITHGINCEYPTIIKDDDFWQWILEVKSKNGKVVKRYAESERLISIYEDC